MPGNSQATIRGFAKIYDPIRHRAHNHIPDPAVVVKSKEKKVTKEKSED